MKKSTEVLPKRLASLRVVWNEFEIKHNKLETSETKTDLYFSTDFYASVHQCIVIDKVDDQ